MIDYSVEIKTSFGFTYNADNLTETTYSQNSEISTGETYQCKVKARNIIGLSEYSAVLDIIAATVP